MKLTYNSINTFLQETLLYCIPFLIYLLSVSQYNHICLACNASWTFMVCKRIHWNTFFDQYPCELFILILTPARSWWGKWTVQELILCLEQPNSNKKSDMTLYTNRDHRPDKKTHTFLCESCKDNHYEWHCITFVWWIRNCKYNGTIYSALWQGSAKLSGKAIWNYRRKYQGNCTGMRDTLTLSELHIDPFLGSN